MSDSQSKQAKVVSMNVLEQKEQTGLQYRDDEKERTNKTPTKHRDQEKGQRQHSNRRNKQSSASPNHERKQAARKLKSLGELWKTATEEKDRPNLKSTSKTTWRISSTMAGRMRNARKNHAGNTRANVNINSSTAITLPTTLRKQAVQRPNTKLVR